MHKVSWCIDIVHLCNIFHPLAEFRRKNELEQFVRIVGETKPTKRDFLFLFTGGVLQLLES
jgi:hypothetical protein